MAERRMFAKRIIDTDMFLDMPATAQLLYFHLGMRADDDGFINNPKRIMRDVRCGNQDMQALIANGYIIPFDTGVIVISHWRMHNYLRADRYTPTDCEDEKAQLLIENKKPYRLTTAGIPSSNQNDNQTGTQAVDNGETAGIPNGKQTVDGLATQDSNRKIIDLDKGQYRGSTVQERELDIYSQPDTDPMKTLIIFYEQNIEPLTPFKLQRLEQMVEEFSFEWVDRATKRLALLSADKRNSRYLGGMLNAWKRTGVAKPWTVDNRPSRMSGKATKSAAEMTDNVMQMLRERGELNDDTRPAEDDTDSGSMP